MSTKVYNDNVNRINNNLVITKSSHVSPCFMYVLTILTWLKEVHKPNSR